jgi:glucose/mannose-6-phosphate isomerase
MSARPDVLGCIDAARRAPERAELALLAVQDSALPSAEDAAVVVVAGLGTAATAAHAVEAVVAPLARRPVFAVTDAVLPAWVGPTGLVLVIDHDEAPAAMAALVADALGRGATVIACTAAGSALAAQVVAGGGTAVAVDAGPVARLALAPLTVGALVVLDRLGFVPGVEPQLDEAVRQLHRRRDALAASSPSAVTRLARRIGRSIPLVSGAGPVGAVAARHWKAQCNTNAKIPAFWSALPELAFDEVAGWGQHGDVTRQVLVSVLLRHAGEAPEHPAAFARLVPVLEESLAAVHVVEAEGNGPLAQLLDLAYLGDLVSLELAQQEGLDPGPAPALGLLVP